MTVDEIEKALIASLGEVQECGGRAISPMTGETCPIGDLEGFDSLNAAETATLLSATLGRKVSYKLLLPRPRDQRLSIREIAQAVHILLRREKGERIDNERA